MKTQQENFIHAFETSPASNTELAVFARRMHGVTSAASALRARIAKYADDSGDAGLRRQAEGLRTWMDINGEGLAVAARAAELGTDWADEISKRLEIASRDLALVEESQGSGNANLAQALSEVNGILDSMEALYRPSAPMLVPAKAVEPAHVFAP